MPQLSLTRNEVTETGENTGKLWGRGKEKLLTRSLNQAFHQQGIKNSSTVDYICFENGLYADNMPFSKDIFK